MISKRIQEIHQFYCTSFQLSERGAIKLVSLVAVMHLAGALGLAWSVSRPFFVWATPFNLLFASFLLLIFHQKWEQKFFQFSVLCFLVGYGIEVLGVHTGLVFGTYWYGQTLGFKIAEVPLTIGLNWFVLTYCFNYFVFLLFEKINIKIKREKNKSSLIKAFFAASGMVALDYWIEPIAIRYDFWQWSDNIVPIQNYMGWWIVSFFLSYVYHHREIHTKNPLALGLLISQILFFLLGHFI
jgi:putative membrane protein